MSLQLQSLAGLVAFPLIAWGLSERRFGLRPSRVVRMIAVGLVLQLAIAGIMLNVAIVRDAFVWPGRLVAALQSATNEGVRLVFGYLAGAPARFEITKPEHAFLLGFQALPLVLIVSVLAKILYHWGILQLVVRAFASGLRASLGVSGPVGTSAAANVFVGMVEAPLLIRPYLATMSRSDLFATMSVGMATIAGTVLALYASLIERHLPGAAGHLIVASVISVPAALLLAALMVPEPASEVSASTPAPIPPDAMGAGIDAPESSMAAIAQGTREGVELLVNVTAMLIVAVALVSLVNMALAGLPEAFGAPVTLQRLLGWAFAPLAWLTGIPWSECSTAGALLGIKTVLNELIAYIQLAGQPADAFSDRSRLILSYALCGFANFGSLGIMLGGLIAMAPQRRADIIALGPRTIVSGSLATLMTAAVVGLLTPA